MPSKQPVLIRVKPPEAAALLHELLLDYQATLESDSEGPFVSVVPIDALRRGTVIYRVIQASRTVAAQLPEAVMHLETEDGSRWRLPPPAL